MSLNVHFPFLKKKYLFFSWNPATIRQHVFRMQLPKRDFSRKKMVIAIRKCEGENEM